MEEEQQASLISTFAGFSTPSLTTLLHPREDIMIWMSIQKVKKKGLGDQI